VQGGDNESDRDHTFSAAQCLRPARRFSPTAIAAATSTNISPNFDTFVLSDSGAVTVDTLLFNGEADDQLGFDGASITLIFSTANITLGAGGNLTATGGARTAGTAARFVYAASVAKWIEV
jgi:hypothetical protein